MPRKLPKEPLHTWKEVLIAIYNEYGQHSTFTSRDVATLLDITIQDASIRLRRARQWGTIKLVKIIRHNVMVHEVTNYGVSKIKDIQEEK